MSKFQKVSLNTFMERFRFWLAERMQSERDNQLQRIWADTFKALGLGGLSDEDAAQQSLSKVTFNQRSPDSHGNTFKGKQAVRKRLENGQIFNRLEQLNDPEIRKNIEDVRRWLDSNDGDTSSNASTTVSNLLQKIFGQDTFQKLIDSDFPKQDDAKAQVQPMPPSNMGQEMPNPDTSANPQPPGQPPMSGMMGQQPQVPQGMAPPQPTNPMPPKPAGAELGMF